MHTQHVQMRHPDCEGEFAEPFYLVQREVIDVGIASLCHGVFLSGGKYKNLERERRAEKDV